MTIRFLAALLPLVLWTCTSSPVPSPPSVPPPLASLPEVPLPSPAGPDDDHRLVSRDEFFHSPWVSLSAVAWTADSQGVSLTLSDQRVARLEWVSSEVLRWWVPSAPGERPLSPAAIYPAFKGTLISREADGVVFLDTPGLGVRLRLSDLSWSLVRGDRLVLQTVGSPRSAGRRLVQGFDARAALRWTGPGLGLGSSSAKFWIGEPGSESSGPWATPGLFGVGGALSLALALDNSYQTYTRVTPTEVNLGSLNGGLDLLIAATSQPVAATEALSLFLGRPPLPPTWALGTALVLPPNEKGDFLRLAKVSVQSAYGAVQTDRPYRSLAPASTNKPLPDLTIDALRRDWTATLGVAEHPAETGIALSPQPNSDDWNARFDDAGRDSPWARMSNQLPGLEARAASEAWEARNPGLRPLVLSDSGAWGTIRNAWPVVQVTAGQDRAALTPILTRSALGLGTPSVYLDLTPLAVPETRSAAYQSLLTWIMAPQLTLDWGPEPARFWASLPAGDRIRLKTILARRSQWKPLFTQLVRLASTQGRPVWQPLWFAVPNDPQALAQDSFLVGDSLLVVPFAGSATRVYLPGPGVWFDFWTGEEFGGGRTYDVEAPLDKPLLFVRGGALIPVREAETFDKLDVYNPLTIHVFPGGRGMGTYYLDDGRTLNWRGGVYWETKLLYDFSQKDMTLEHVAVNTAPGIKSDPYLLYRIHNVFKPKQVKIDGKPIPLFGDSWGITDSDRSAAWYESDHTLLVKTFRPEKAQTIVLSF